MLPQLEVRGTAEGSFLSGLPGKTGMVLLESPEAALTLVQKPQHRPGKEIRGRGRSSVLQFLLLPVPAAELSPLPRPWVTAEHPGLQGWGVTQELQGEMLQRGQIRFSTDSLFCGLWRVSPGQQQSTHRLLPTASVVGRGENWKSKSEKKSSVGEDRVSRVKVRGKKVKRKR